MRTRIVSIQIDEDQDGRKRTVRKSYPADAMLLLAPHVAGEGFLAIVRDLAGQLDGVSPAPAAFPAAIAAPPAPDPQSIPDAPVPARKPGPFESTHFSNTTPKPTPPKPGAAKPGEKGVRFQADPKKVVDTAPKPA